MAAEGLDPTVILSLLNLVPHHQHRYVRHVTGCSHGLDLLVSEGHPFPVIAVVPAQPVEEAGTAHDESQHSLQQYQQVCPAGRLFKSLRAGNFHPLLSPAYHPLPFLIRRCSTQLKDSQTKGSDAPHVQVSSSVFVDGNVAKQTRNPFHATKSLQQVSETAIFDTTDRSRSVYNCDPSAPL
ncbi:hypothetical protein BDV10DRAFT_176797 [Aspergillus recurvatus]